MKEVVQVEDLKINQESIVSALANPERADEFMKFASVLIKRLNADEQKLFADKPVHFVSQEFLYSYFKFH